MTSTDQVVPVNLHMYSHLIPDRPLVVSGAFGGPFVVGGLRKGWTGGVYPSVPAVPQFVTLGPLYHVYSGLVGPYLALLITAATESAFTFGAHSRNAQMAYSANVEPSKRFQKYSSSFSISGPGLTAHILRNTVGMSGIRVFSNPIKNELDKLFPAASDRAKRTAGDFIGSLFSGILSTPFNQMFNFLATSQNVREMTLLQRLHYSKEFLKRQYFSVSPDGGFSFKPSPVMLRDIGLRSIYSMGLFGIYGTIERNLLIIPLWIIVHMVPGGSNPKSRQHMVACLAIFSILMFGVFGYLIFVAVDNRSQIDGITEYDCLLVGKPISQYTQTVDSTVVETFLYNVIISSNDWHNGYLNQCTFSEPCTAYHTDASGVECDTYSYPISPKPCWTTAGNPYPVCSEPSASWVAALIGCIFVGLIAVSLIAFAFCLFGSLTSRWTTTREVEIVETVIPIAESNVVVVGSGMYPVQKAEVASVTPPPAAK